MVKATRDIGASVRARLLNLARERGQVLDLLLTRYALERLLYRLSLSVHRNRFVLKGAMLVTTWFEDPHRPTRDLDLLGYGDPSAEAMSIVWKEICRTVVDDGIASGARTQRRQSALSVARCLRASQYPSFQKTMRSNRWNTVAV
jgi:predicted nucleotidyltransferase component of viral defense system